MNIEGAHVVITGGSRGIGEALGREFAAEGARVTLVARSTEALERLAKELGGSAVTADLLDTDARRRLVSRVEETAGPIDVLVNNAGIDEVGDFLSTNDDAIERLFTLNNIAPVALCRQVLPGMIDRGRGHLVNVSSLAGAATLPGTVTYSATKSALTHFTTGLRTELLGLPIDLTVVEVGVVDTDMGTSVESHPPFRAAHRRYQRLGLLSLLSAEKVAKATVKAVRSRKRHVRLPRRAAAFPALAGTPRRLNEIMLGGVRRREQS